MAPYCHQMRTFEAAMRMELEGCAFYREHAEGVEQPELKRILLELAEDELKHFALFEGLRDGRAVEYDESTKTQIVRTLKCVYTELRASGEAFYFGDDAAAVWAQARDLERQAETYYRQQAFLAAKPNEREALNKIADEEYRHRVVLEQVLEFLEDPAGYLDSSEWSQLSDTLRPLAPTAEVREGDARCGDDGESAA